jgi:aromatic-amino-acid transaminase
MVLADPELRTRWEGEVKEMRERIQRMRALFVKGLADRGIRRDFSFIAQQKGMFSYSGLDLDAVRRLRSEFSIYIVDSGRICVAAMNETNIGRITDAIAKVL